MGYFSNGTEGEAYEEQYCAKCANANTDNGFCPIMNLHSSWNYEQHSDPLKKAALEHFIPRSATFQYMVLRILLDTNCHLP